MVKEGGLLYGGNHRKKVYLRTSSLLLETTNYPGVRYLLGMTPSTSLSVEESALELARAVLLSIPRDRAEGWLNLIHLELKGHIEAHSRVHKVGALEKTSFLPDS